mgnify:CR=1 FL=1
MTQIGMLKETPIPVNIQVDTNIIDSLIEMKKEGGAVSRENQNWELLSKIIASLYGLNEDDYIEVRRWMDRRYLRPGESYVN